MEFSQVMCLSERAQQYHQVVYTLQGSERITTSYQNQGTTFTTQIKISNDIYERSNKSNN